MTTVEGVAVKAVSIAWLCPGWILACWLKVLWPHGTLALTPFGNYIGTLNGRASAL